MMDKQESGSIVSNQLEDQETNYWDVSAQDVYMPNDFKVYWETLDQIQAYQYQVATGYKDQDFLTFSINYVKENIGTKNLYGLFIGCVEIGTPEIRLFETGYFECIEIMDIAEGLLKRQEQRAIQKGFKNIKYIKQDLNNVTLKPNTYDFIFAQGTIHHVENLEGLFEQLKHALKDNGVFITREYVGPNRVQFTKIQTRITNGILAILPKRYRVTAHNTIKLFEPGFDLEQLIKLDPSESVRSEDVIPVLRRDLEIVRLANTGGTILHPLLNNIAANFEKDKIGKMILKGLILFERLMIKTRLLPSDYVFCVAKKRC